MIGKEFFPFYGMNENDCRLTNIGFRPSSFQQTAESQPGRFGWPGIAAGIANIISPRETTNPRSCAVRNQISAPSTATKRMTGPGMKGLTRRLRAMYAGTIRNDSIDPLQP